MKIETRDLNPAVPSRTGKAEFVKQNIRKVFSAIVLVLALSGTILAQDHKDKKSRKAKNLHTRGVSTFLRFR